MRLQPYVRVDGTLFTATREAIIGQRGTPGRVARNAVGLNELDYGDVVFRFQDGGGLEEITRRAPVLYLVGSDGVVDVPFAALATRVRRADARAFERAGFLVSPRWGVAFVAGEPDWVTALASHCVGAWRRMGGRCAP